MKTYQKIFLLWGGIVIAMSVSAMFVPHSYVPLSRFLNVAVQLLIAIVAGFLTWREPVRKNRFLFLNFAIYSFVSLCYYLYVFVDTFLANLNPYLPFYVTQYLGALHYGLLVTSIVYVVLDSLFRDWSVLLKYAGALLIVVGFFWAYFLPFISNPNYAYSTGDIQDFVAVDHEYRDLMAVSGTEPSAEEIAQHVALPAWDEGAKVGQLDASHNLARVTKLYAYLPGDNYLVLLWKPLNLFLIRMNVVICFFILLFFGYQYRKDPPQGAFIDKIMFLFLVFSSMDILHAWSYINAVELQELLQYFEIGQYVTIFILLLIAAFFAARLRFVTSVSGEFYENELVHSAQHITRWRDWIDNLVVSHFFNAKAVRGTLFSQRSEK